MIGEGTHLFNPELVMFAGVAAVFIAAGCVDDIPGEEIFIGREQISIELKILPFDSAGISWGLKLTCQQRYIRDDSLQ